MKTIILITVLFAACTTDTMTPEPMTQECVSQVIENCGERPVRPNLGSSVAFENGKAVLDAAVWQQYEIWQHDIDLWAKCASFAEPVTQ